MTDGVTVERAPPEDVFSLLGNELRVDILEALAETPDETVSFSTLRERVDRGDAPRLAPRRRPLRPGGRSGMSVTTTRPSMAGVLCTNRGIVHHTL